MDAAQWPQQEMGLVVMPSSSMADMISSTTTACTQTRPPNPVAMEKRTTRPQKEQALNCPRCNSSNTKFCYYNNYSLTQPRYFCKTCRRYWTEGGSLRNVPVGGGSRKNKRSSSSSPFSSSSTSNSSSTVAAASTTTPHHRHSPINSAQNPKFHDVHDLNLSFPHHHYMAGNPNTTNSVEDMVRSGISSREFLNPFVPMSIQAETSTAGTVYYQSGGFPMQDLSRSAAPLSFPTDGIGVGSSSTTRYENMQQEGSTGGRMLLPFEDLRQMAAASGAATHEYHHERNRAQGGDSSGFWSGVMGGGGAAW